MEATITTRRSQEAVDEAVSELLMLSEYLQYVQRSDRSDTPNPELNELIKALSAITSSTIWRPGLTKYLH